MIRVICMLCIAFFVSPVHAGKSKNVRLHPSNSGLEPHNFIAIPMQNNALHFGIHYPHRSAVCELELRVSSPTLNKKDVEKLAASLKVKGKKALKPKIHQMSARYRGQPAYTLRYHLPKTGQVFVTFLMLSTRSKNSFRAVLDRLYQGQKGKLAIFPVICPKNKPAKRPSK